MRLLFGECEFDSGQRLVRRHGSVNPLSPKALQLLEILLDRRPEVVSKAELLEQLWPGTFVSDASLHNLVAEVRAAIGDAPHPARFIRTVPRYGYAFHGDARAASPDPAPRAPRSGPHLLSSGGAWPLAEGANIVGRDHACDIRIDALTLSRRHARIVLTGGVAIIEDLDSKNGTRVNGQPIMEQLSLNDGDEIEMGSLLVTYRVIDAAPSTVTRQQKSD
jgi:DNA-binding winged helix-turn-helix (wHTH) protein